MFRGLLPPNIVVEDYGVVRTDAGMMGAGLYFTDSVKYVIRFYSSAVQCINIYLSI